MFHGLIGSVEIHVSPARICRYIDIGRQNHRRGDIQPKAIQITGKTFHRMIHLLWNKIPLRALLSLRVNTGDSIRDFQDTTPITTYLTQFTYLFAPVLNRILCRSYMTLPPAATTTSLSSLESHIKSPI